MTTKIQPTILTISSFSELEEDLISSYLDFQEAIHRSIKRREVLRSRKYRQKKLLEPNDSSHARQLSFAIINRQIVGYAYTFYQIIENDPNPEKMEIRVEVHPEYRCQNIGSQLANHIVSYAKSLGRTKFESWFSPIDGPEGERFCRKYGLHKVMEEKVSRLYREKINWSYVVDRESKYQSLSEKYDIVMLDRNKWADRILNEDGFAEEMADFLTEVLNLMPTEDIDFNGYVEHADNLRSAAKRILVTPTSNSLNYYAFDGDKIIGMSGNFYPIDPPVRDVGTGLTGIRKSYQGKGLATLLKIKVIRNYVDEFPDFEYIQTENAASNDAMLSINYGLGFETVHSWELWQS